MEERRRRRRRRRSRGREKEVEEEEERHRGRIGGGGGGGEKGEDGTRWVGDLDNDWGAITMLAGVCVRVRVRVDLNQCYLVGVWVHILLPGVKVVFLRALAESILTEPSPGGGGGHTLQGSWTELRLIRDPPPQRHLMMSPAGHQGTLSQVPGGPAGDIIR